MNRKVSTGFIVRTTLCGILNWNINRLLRCQGSNCYMMLSSAYTNVQLIIPVSMLIPFTAGMTYTAYNLRYCHEID